MGVYYRFNWLTGEKYSSSNDLASNPIWYFSDSMEYENT